MFRMGLIGKKIGMTRIYVDGEQMPVTVLELGPNQIVQKKTPDGKDGYGAIQLGFDAKSHKKLNKPMKGHYGRSDVRPYWVLKELRVPNDDKLKEFSVGQELKCDVFKTGDFVDVTGKTKGKGFQGVMRLHHMKGSKQYTHGTHEYRRHPGSIGCRTTPGRVHPGKRLPRHMGDDRVTVQNLKVVKVDADRNLLLLQGSIPGANEGYVVVRQAVKKLGRAMAKKKT
ncbi:MAG: 50S ribosomal protein L3 [Deltaproteobacteria bacterium]|nr:50S ribosomal protein L3 [Deltaproteobacteria bacterium]